MVVGSIIFATESGLGTLAKLFYDLKVIDKVCIVPNKRYESHLDWYSREDILEEDELLDNIDTLFLLEAPLPDPYNWYVINKARARGVRVVLMPMYESTPLKSPELIDKFICPSQLDLQYYKEYNSLYLNVPFPNNVEWKLREKANVFVHNAGHGGVNGRNGTIEIIKSLDHIKSQDIQIIINVQHDADISLIRAIEQVDDSRVKVNVGSIPYDELWSIGDVFLFPEKYNGLSLPLQEALASGMLVMAANRFPVNRWLPPDPLIPVKCYEDLHLPWVNVTLKSAIVDPVDIAKTIDEWAGRDITVLSNAGKTISKYFNGSNLVEQYRKELDI